MRLDWSSLPVAQRETRKGCDRMTAELWRECSSSACEMDGEEKAQRQGDGVGNWEASPGKKEGGPGTEGRREAALRLAAGRRAGTWLLTAVRAVGGRVRPPGSASR